MKHLRVAYTPEEIERINTTNAKRKRNTRVTLPADMQKGQAACRAVLGPEDELVESALGSECDDCRLAVGVAKKGDKTWEGSKPIGVKPPQTWEEAPMADAEALIASAMKNRG